MIIIPRAEASKYRKIKLAWHTGIDAIELRNGDYFLKEECFDMLPVGFKYLGVEIRTELAKLPRVELKKSDFKVAELEEITR